MSDYLKNLQENVLITEAFKPSGKKKEKTSEKSEEDSKKEKDSDEDEDAEKEENLLKDI